MHKLSVVFLYIAILSAAPAHTAIDNKDLVPAFESNVDLVRGFQNPPMYARPRVFWWWLNSMATKESITRDLEALKAKGFGGALLFDAGSSAYIIAARTPPGPQFAGEAWKELFLHALKEADRLGLEISLNIQSGWNPGGPSVTPEDGMKKIVSTEVVVTGPTRFDKELTKGRGYFYRDIAVQAYRIEPSAKTAPIKNWRYKSVNRSLPGSGNYPFEWLRVQFPAVADEQDVHSASIVDISPKMDEYGRLKWDVPPGTWRIIRYGSVLTGAQVSTSSHGWQGLSFDHLSAKALDRYLAAVVDPILESAGKYVGRSLKYLHTDSWEMGPVNWTEDFPVEFEKRRGYDMMPYLPVLAGKNVDSRDASNRFLYDFRKTIGDLIADRMYSRFAEYAHERGLMVHPESGGPHSAPIDALKCLGRNDVPMGEFWARAETHRASDDARLFIKQSSSAAHIYGKRFIAGEGPTSIGPHWERSPKDLKSVFDRNFCEGINRFFWHEFAGSPEEYGLPGLEYFAGTHLNPNTTWWRQSHAWTQYLSRTSFLLSQGLFQADVVMYYGDDVPNFVLRKRVIEGLGPGYDYDECNAEVLLTRMSVKDGKIILPDGMSYHLLRLPDREAITLNVLQKIEALVWEGAAIVGPKPTRATGLEGYPDANVQVREIADRLWGDCDGETVTENRYGKGRVFWGTSMRQVLLADGVSPDFEFTSALDSTMLDFTHRKTKDADIYFVVNRLARNGIYDTKYRYLPTLPDRYEEVECVFRVSGKQPEIWDPMSGRIIEQPVYRLEKGRTIVSLRLGPEASAFVIFRKEIQAKPIVAVRRQDVDIFPVTPQSVDEWPSANVFRRKGRLFLLAFKAGDYTLQRADGKIASVTVDAIPSVQEITGPWELSFPDGWGAPQRVVFNTLISWTDSDNSGIKYFSGTATYRKRFHLKNEATEGVQLYLDLGNVQELAEVKVNGKPLGVLWMPPFRADITDAVHAGENELEIRVTNLWPNRLIGDQLLSPQKRYTKTNIRKFHKDFPLRISGLLGPVRIVFAERATVKF